MNTNSDLLLEGNDPILIKPHLDEEAEKNKGISPSEVEEGLSLEDLRIGDLVEVKTKHRSYILENRGNGQVLISGHPEYCPQPLLVKLNGSTWGGLMIKVGFIGRGMSLEFRHPLCGIIRTSRIQAIRQLEPKSQVSGLHLATRN